MSQIGRANRRDAARREQMNPGDIEAAEPAEGDEERAAAAKPTDGPPSVERPVARPAVAPEDSLAHSGRGMSLSEARCA